MIPENHPRYQSLIVREQLVRCAKEGIVTLEGLTAHGRGEAFDYLMGEQTSPAALQAERIAAALLLTADHPVISVNGNTAALAAGMIAGLQEASGASVEVNLFHRTDERITRITRLLEEQGVRVLKGEAKRLLPLLHDRALCLPRGIGSADVILVPLEDGDRCQALHSLGKKVIAIDLNPLSRTAQSADLTIVDEVTRALPLITTFCRELDQDEAKTLSTGYDNKIIRKAALDEIIRRLTYALD
jgi:4-phosphopantoate--beta-alanine ligase